MQTLLVTSGRAQAEPEGKLCPFRVNLAKGLRAVKWTKRGGRRGLVKSVILNRRESVCDQTMCAGECVCLLFPSSVTVP